MALNRAPTAIQVNGAALLVKDGDSSSGLFGKFQRVPGLANYTLPDETGSTNEVQLMDGSVAFAQIAGVGTITGSIGAITGHPVHQFLAAKRRSGGNIVATIIRPAVEVIDADEAAITDDAAAVAEASAGVSAVTLAVAKRNIREGMIAAVHSASPVGYLAYSDAAEANMAKFQSVVAVNDTGLKFSVSPGVSGVVTDSSGDLMLYVRRPGILYASIGCTVNGFGDGDFQAGTAVGANISLQPAEALTASVPETRLITELATATSDTNIDSAFADIA